MMFSQNLQYLRKEKNMTQEQLAEKLEVSRQAVSKWEAGSAYPEMDKIIVMCRMFDIDMDTLVNGNVKKPLSEDEFGYDTFYNKCSRAVAFGVSLIIAGAAILIAMGGEKHGKEGLLILFLLVAVAVVTFVWFGIQMDHFEKKHRSVTDFYKEEEKERFRKRFALGIAAGVGLILVGVIIVIASSLVGIAPHFAVSGMMVCIAFAVYIFVYFGMQQQKYNIEEFNEKNIKETSAKAEKYNSIIMLSATAIFLLLGFLGGYWHPAWVVFPLGGIMCGIVSTELQKTKE